VDQRGPALRVHYHGTIVPQRLPLAIIDALRLTPPNVHLDVTGYQTIGAPDHRRALLARAHELGVADRISLRAPAVSRRELLCRCDAYDVGLALMPPASDDVNLRHMVGASNKPYDYLARGLALLVTDLPDWRAAFVGPGYARACDPLSPASIAESLTWFLQHPVETRAMGERGRRRVLEDWHYERSFSSVLSLLENPPPGHAALT
jgi:glycosyltransferase involved in cell wall biosynthesis